MFFVARALTLKANLSVIKDISKLQLLQISIQEIISKIQKLEN